jgi:Domain of unknown function DUF11
MALRIARVVAAVALATALFAAPAAAIVSNPIPMNASEEPADAFYDNEPLYAYATTTPSGGQICAIKPREDAAGDGSLTCDALDAWGDSTKFASGIGSTFVPLSAPPLPPGRWMLLADNAPPASDWISDEFVVYPCTLEDQCPDAWGAEAKESFKTAMRVMYFGSQSSCHLLKVLAYAPQAIATYEVMTVLAPAWGLGGAFAAGVGTFFVVDAAGELDPRLDVDDLITNLVEETACKWAKKSKEIADDPPDSDYGEVAPVAFDPVRLSGDETADAMGTALNRMTGYGDALLTAYERFQGAEAGGAEQAMRSQAQAVADAGFALAGEMRRGADSIEAFSDALAADPDVPDPALTEDVRDAIIAMQDRVRTTGFTPDELDSLREAGLDDAGIALAREALGDPITSAPTGVSYPSVLDAMAEDIRESIDEVTTFSRGAAAAAGRTPPPSTIVIREHTVPAGADARFGYSAPSGGFDLADGESKSLEADPGVATVAANFADGYTLTSVECDDGASADPSETAGSSAAVHLEPGETVTCTFTHTRNATLSVRVETAPVDHTGRSFAFELDGGTAPFELVAGEQKETPLPAGEHVLVQRDTAGTSLDAITCDDADSSTSVAERSATVRAAPGERVECTFSSLLTTARLELESSGTPAGAQSAIGHVEASFASFDVTDGSTAAFDVEAGDHTLEVTPASGAHVAALACGDQAGAAGALALHVEPGALVKCSLGVVHDSPGRVEVENVVDAAVSDPAFEFPYSASAPIGDLKLRPGEHKGAAVWPGGTYALNATLSGVDYELTALSCDDADSTTSPDSRAASALVGAGETVRCSFTWRPLAMVSAGPLRRILTSPDLGCGVNHVRDEQPSFFGDLACGTFLSSGDLTYGPASVPAGPSHSALTAVARSLPAGAGTRANPLRVVTEAVAAETGLRIRQTDSYVVGEEAYKTSVRVTNESGETRAGQLYRAADCYLQDSDAGFGDSDADTGAVGCRSAEATEQGTVRGTRIEQWFPLTPGSHRLEAAYATVWGFVAGGTPFDDTCLCDAHLDNGAGLNWPYSLAPGESATFEHLTTFSPLGRKPLVVDARVQPATVVAGGRVDYAIEVRNDNASAVGLDRVSFTLPPGFAYVPGSTQGAGEPSAAGRVLTWTAPGAAAAGASRTVRFGARAAVQPGAYDGEAAADPADPFSAVPTGPAARVTVTPDATPPAVDLRTPPEGARYTRGAGVAADFSCTDADSGIAECTGTVADGAAVATTPAGTRTFDVTAVDRAGNRTVVRHAYEVVGPTATPTPTPTPTATPTPTPKPKPKPKGEVKSEQAVSLGLPASRRCVSRRRFPIRLRAPKGMKLKSARVWVDGKRVAVRKRGGRLVATIDLRGMRKGRFAVQVRAVTADGRKVRDKRRYRTCAKKRGR